MGNDNMITFWAIVVVSVIILLPYLAGRGVNGSIVWRILASLLLPVISHLYFLYEIAFKSNYRAKLKAFFSKRERSKRTKFDHLISLLFATSLVFIFFIPVIGAYKLFVVNDSINSVAEIKKEYGVNERKIISLKDLASDNGLKETEKEKIESMIDVLNKKNDSLVWSAYLSKNDSSMTILFQFDFVKKIAVFCEIILKGIIAVLLIFLALLFSKKDPKKRSQSTTAGEKFKNIASNNHPTTAGDKFESIVCNQQPIKAQETVAKIVIIKPFNQADSHGFEWDGRILKPYGKSSSTGWEFDGKYIAPYNRPTSERWEWDGTVFKPYNRSSSEGWEWNGTYLKPYNRSSSEGWEWNGRYLWQYNKSQGSGWISTGDVPIPVIIYLVVNCIS